MNENALDKTTEEFLQSIKETDLPGVLKAIDEVLWFSNSLSIAFQSMDNPGLQDIQSSIVIDRLRLTLIGIEGWIKLNAGANSVPSSDEL